MTTERPRGAIIALPAVSGNLACEARQQRATGQAARAEYIRKAHSRKRQRARQRRVALTVSVIVVAVLLAAFTPWSGTERAKSSEVPAQRETSTAALPSVTEDKPKYIPNAAEVEALAKMLYGEARGIASDTEKAACVWCVLNRVDDPRFPDTVLEVLSAPYQFAGYSAEYPATEELKTLAADVLTRYHAEKDGESNVGRVLPAEYCFFTGDGKNNHFTIGWKDTDTWGWTLESPYED